MTDKTNGLTDVNASMHKNGVWRLPKTSFPIYKTGGYSGLVYQHYYTHHANYVNNLNRLEKKIKECQQGDYEPLNDLTERWQFNYSGHFLHTLYWRNLDFKQEKSGLDSAEVRKSKFYQDVQEQFGGFRQLKYIISAMAANISGVGWIVLGYNFTNGKLVALEIKDHQIGMIPSFHAVLAIDVWEHAYYKKYGPDKAQFIADIWQCINWSSVCAVAEY